MLKYINSSLILYIKMWVNNFNPIIVGKTGLIPLDITPLEIRWYGVVYVLGFFLSIWWLNYLHQQGKLKLNRTEIWDLGFYALLGILIGSRLFEVFWEPAYYLSNPLNFLKFWQGGMSFHGGFVGIITACWLYCRKKKINFWEIADAFSVPTIFALALGRIANFINGELVGKVWESARENSWCVIFPNYDELCRHPQVLYSAGERFLVFFWLFWLSFRKKYNFKPGFIFWNFVLWEGLGRFLIDFYREDILYFSLTVGQWFSAVMVVVAGFLLWKKYQEDIVKIFSQKSI